MKITISQKNFKKALTVVEKIISKNTSLPILSNILLKTENGRLKLSATNLELGINYVTGAKVDEIGQVAVPGRILSDFISGVNEEKISLVTRDNTLFINSDKYKTQILGFNPADFPIIPKIKEVICTLPAKSLRNALLTVLESVAISESRPELAGVYINFSGNQIAFASTDSFRLTEKIVDFKSEHTQSLILPRNTAVELIRILGDLEDEVDFNMGDNQVAFSNNDFELVSRVIEGNYPDYQKVIPDKFISRTLVDKENLETNIRLAGLFSSNISDVKINCADNKLQIIARNSERGEIEVVTDAVLKNEPFGVSLNFHYLLDGLKAINTDKILIEFTGQGSPLVIRPGDSDKKLVYLIMPLRN